MPANPLDIFASVVSPDQLKTNRAQELAQRGFDPQGGAALGSNIRRFLQGGGQDKERAQAERSQKIVGEAASQIPQLIQAGNDPEMAQIIAMQDAASKLNAAGSIQDAAALTAQMVQISTARDIRKAEIAKLNAGASLQGAQADALKNPSEAESKSESIRLQSSRATKIAQLARNPEGPQADLLIKEIGELDREIAKRGTITGRTAEDVGGKRQLKKTTQDLQKNFLDSANGLIRLQGIEQFFDPAFLSFGGRFKQGLRKFGDMAGFDMSADEKRQFIQHVTFKQNAIDNLNRYIKEITGAQMSEAEAVRLGKAIPNAETDSPEEFRAKMINATFTLDAMNRRSGALLDSGLVVEDMDGYWDSAGHDFRDFMDDEGLQQALFGATEQPIQQAGGQQGTGLVPATPNVQAILDAIP